MKTPIALLILCLAAAVASLEVPGTLPFGLFELSLLAALAAGMLALRAVLRCLLQRGQAPEQVLIDGSNVMYWAGGQPSLGKVRAVVQAVQGDGLTPVIGFDANVGYLVGTSWLGPGPLARVLGVEPEQVFVAPKGTPADPLLLDRAHRVGARVVTNDRFRDWIESRPWLTEPGFLIRGRIRDGVVLLQTRDQAAPAEPQPAIHPLPRAAARRAEARAR